MNCSQAIEQLKHGTPDQQCDAAQALAGLAEAAQPASVTRVETLERNDDSVCEWCVAALEQLGPPGRGDVPRLAELAGSENELIGYWACTLLGRLAAVADPASTELAAVLLESSSLAVRQRAAWALGKIGTCDQQAVMALRQAASSEDQRLARLASQALEAGEQST